MKSISIVVVSRNDNPDSDNIVRLNLFINNIIKQIVGLCIEVEVIIIEWNPPENQKYLKDVIELKEFSRMCKLRIITVPKEYHKELDNSQLVNMFQMIAKNVGIRRANGEFILVTNIDILLSREFFLYFAKGKIKKEYMYRTDRYDVDSQVISLKNINKVMPYCKNNIIKVYSNDFTHIIDKCMLDLQILYLKLFIKTILRIVKKILGMERTLHTNACGDFTLMTKENWLKSGGYPEFPLSAMKIDGLLCYNAHYSGAREKVLPQKIKIYHVDHKARSDGAEIALKNRENSIIKYFKYNNVPLEVYSLNNTYISQITSAQYSILKTEITKNKKPIIFNYNDWGLVNNNFNEVVI